MLNTFGLCFGMAMLALLNVAVISSPPSADTQARNQALIGAVEKGDVPVVRSLLKQGVDPNARKIVLSKPDASRNIVGGQPVPTETALILAARNGSIEIATMLLQRGAKVNARDDYNGTAVMEAVRCNQEKMVRLLLEKGANPNLRNSNGDTAIHFAAHYGNIPIVTLLLEKGAGINGGQGMTPLMSAAAMGHEKLVALLLQKGAKVNFKRPDTLTPLEYALMQQDKNEEVIHLLRQAGSKARPIAELKRDADTMLKEYIAREKAQAKQWKSKQTITPDDKAVIETVLMDMLNYQGKDLNWREERKSLVLFKKTVGGSGMISDDQLNGELDEKQANDVTVKIRQELTRRNWEAVSLEDFTFTNPNIILGEPKFEHITTFVKQFPRAKGWIQIYLPGFSEQRDTAVVRLHFGPTPHGASATYFLRKENGNWQVKWRNFTYYA